MATATASSSISSSSAATTTTTNTTSTTTVASAASTAAANTSASTSTSSAANTNTTTTITTTTNNTSNANSLDSDKSAPKGVYKNPRLMHVSTTIVGCTVQLQTKDGAVWNGIFDTFSSEFSICLDLAVHIDPKLKSQDCLFQALKNGSKAQEKAFFDLKDIVRITVTDVDLNYAIKEMDKIVTDTDISGFNASKAGERRELETWQDDDGDNANEESLLSLDEVAISTKNGSQNNSRTGWDAQDMFRYNERVHKVNSTYDEDLHDYTIALPKPGKHDKDWRKKQDRAAAIAREIETNPQSQNRIAKEDGSDDEEEKFSSVVRTQNDANDQQKHQQQHKQQQPPSAQQPTPASQHHQQQVPHGSNDQATSLTPSLSHQHQQSQSNQQHMHQHQHPHQHQHQSLHHQQNQHPRQIPNRINNTAHNKNIRPRYNPRSDSRLDSFKNFGRQFNIAPTPRQPQSQVNQMQGSPASNQSQPPAQQSHQKQNRLQHSQHQSTQPQAQQHSQSQQQQPLQQSKQQTPQPNQQPSLQQTQHAPQQHNQQSAPQLQQHHHHQPPQQQQQQQPQQQQPQMQHQQQPPQQQQQPLPPQSTQQQQLQSQSTPKTATPAPSSTSTSVVDTSLTSERSDTSSSMSANQQSELAKKSTLNPNAKEFVYKPRSPASIQVAQADGAYQSAVGIAPAMDPTNSSPMIQATHGAYYQQVPIFSHGLPPHQQQPHHPSQFIPNHAHMHFQSQIHYMPTPMAPHFAPQQVSPRYIRGNFQNYHHRNGDHMNNVRAAYPQTSMAVPTSASGQPYVPSPSGGQPHHMNTFAMGSPQQSIVYGGPPQSVYPMPPANFYQPL